MNLISSDVSEEISPVDDSGSFGDSWSDLYGDSSGFSECVPVVLSGVLVVTRVSASPSLCLARLSLLTLIVILSNRSPLLSPESVEPFEKESREDIDVANSAEDVQQMSRRSTQEVD